MKKAPKGQRDAAILGMMFPDFFQGYSSILQPWGSGACVWFHTYPRRIWCTQEWFSNWATTWKGQKHLYDSSAYWCSSVSPKSDWFVIGMDLFHNLSWIYLLKTQFGELVSEKPETNSLFLSISSHMLHMEAFIIQENTEEGLKCVPVDLKNNI